MWRNTMPRGLRLSLAAVGALVVVGAPTATAAPSDGANEVTTTCRAHDHHHCGSGDNDGGADDHP